MLRLLVLRLSNTPLHIGFDSVRMLFDFILTTAYLSLATGSPVNYSSFVWRRSQIIRILQPWIKSGLITVIVLRILIELLQLHSIYLMPRSVALWCVDSWGILSIETVKLPLECITGALWSSSKVTLLINACSLCITRCWFLALISCPIDIVLFKKPALKLLVWLILIQKIIVSCY